MTAGRETRSAVGTYVDQAMRRRDQETTMDCERQRWVADRAYDIWQHEGRPQGAALRHWLQAEEELCEAERSALGRQRTTGQPAAADHATEVET
jgi:hypothetical protein